MLKLNRTAWLRVCMVALVALALAGCDDGDSGEENDTSGGDTSTGDTTGDTSVTPDGDEDTTTDTAGGDTGGDTTPGDTTADMEPDIGEPLPITWPADPQGYVDTAASVSYLNTLVIPPLDDNDVPTCCKDFGAISADFIESEGATNDIDNALANLANSLSSFFNVQDTLTEQIESGSFAILWDHREFNGEASADFVLAGLLGTFDTGTTYVEANAGTGTFLVNAASFSSGGTPIINFNPANLTNNSLSAGPSTFLLSLPLGIATLDVSVSEAELTGTSSISGTDVSYSAGTLSGYVLTAEIVTAINALLMSDTCACLGLMGNVFEYDETVGVVANCLDSGTVDAACVEDSEQACRALAGGTVEAGGSSIPVCGLLPSFVNSVADIDTNGDCAIDPDNCLFDALSVGFQWTAVPATLAGVAP